MMATTRAASTVPASIRSTSPDASLTCRIGTLRTSMGSGTLSSPFVGCHDGTGASRYGVGDPVEGGDDGALAAALHEPARRLDLGPHGTAGEVSVGGVPAQFAGGDGAQRPGVVGAPPDDGGVHVGGDDEPAGADPPAQQRRREVLVNHRFDTTEGTVGPAHDRDAAATGRDHEVPGRDERLDGGGVEHV